MPLVPLTCEDFLQSPWCYFGFQRKVCVASSLTGSTTYTLSNTNPQASLSASLVSLNHCGVNLPASSKSSKMLTPGVYSICLQCPLIFQGAVISTLCDDKRRLTSIRSRIQDSSTATFLILAYIVLANTLPALASALTDTTT